MTVALQADQRGASRIRTAGLLALALAIGAWGGHLATVATEPGPITIEDILAESIRRAEAKGTIDAGQMRPIQTIRDISHRRSGSVGSDMGRD